MNYLIIGAGGVASYFLSPFLKTFKPDSVTLFDGDKLEERNLDRQLFKADQVGMSKAEALAQLYPYNGDFNVISSYYSEIDVLNESLPRPDIIICMADNHRARRTALSAADHHKALCIIGGNEYYCSEAYAYDPRWEESDIDPRNRFPEILTDVTGDPMSCQGDEAMASAPQLATANHTCASMILSLIYMWTKTAPELAELGVTLIPDKVPVEYVSNFNGIHSKTINQLKNDRKPSRKLQNTR